jgi:hypothetical protein
MNTDNTDITISQANAIALNSRIAEERNSIYMQLNRIPVTNAMREIVKRSLPSERHSELNSILYVGDLLRYQSISPSYENKLSELDLVAQLRLVNSNIPRTFSERYPELSTRLNTNGPLTAMELSQFTQNSSIIETSLPNQIQTNLPNVLSLFNSNLNSMGPAASIMGSFCSLNENFFGLISNQRDMFSGTSFAGDLPQIGSNLPPFLDQITSQLGTLTSLVDQIRTLASGTQTNMQDALSTLMGSLGVLAQFQNETNSEDNFRIQWDLAKIKEDLIEANSIFDTTILPDTNKKLGDIDQNGLLNSTDETLFQNYIDENTTIAIQSYIERKMFVYMSENFNMFSEYSLIPSRESSNTAIETVSQLQNSFSSASGNMDFGLSDIQNMSSLVSSLESQTNSLFGQVQSSSQLVTNNRVEVTNIMSSLDQIRSLSVPALESVFSSFNSVFAEFRRTSETALGEAEAVSVTDRERTREISDANRTAHSDEVSPALSNMAEVSGRLAPELNRTITVLQGLFRNLAATGILENTSNQLHSLVDTSAEQVASRLSTLNITSLSNGFHFNMTPAYQQFAMGVARASLATTDEARNRMHEVVDGNIAVAAQRYRNLERRDVDFVASRFCDLASEIERNYRQLTVPLETMQQQAQASIAPLTAPSEQTQRALEAGAVRYTTEQRTAAARAAGIDINATITRPYITPSAPFTGSTGTPTPVPAGRRSTVPTGAAPPHIETGPAPSPIDPSRYADLPTFAQLRGGIVWNGLFKLAPWITNADHWDPILQRSEGIEMLRRFLAVAREWRDTGGAPPQIISAFRRGARVAGSGNPSQHSFGKALDIGFNRENQLRFANLAYRGGFRGIGSYRTFLHVDTGRQANWVANPGGQYHPGHFLYYTLPGENGNKRFR